MIFLKLVEVGVPREKIGLLTIPLTPLNFILPFLIGKILKDHNYFKHFTLSVLIRSTTIVIFFSVFNHKIFSDSGARMTILGFSTSTYQEVFSIKMLKQNY